MNSFSYLRMVQAPDRAAALDLAPASSPAIPEPEDDGRSGSPPERLEALLDRLEVDDGTDGE